MTQRKSNERFRRVIERAIEGSGLTLSQLSRDVDIPLSTLFEWTSGSTPRLGPDILRFCRRLDICLEDLIEDSDGREQTQEQPLKWIRCSSGDFEQIQVVVSDEVELKISRRIPALKSRTQKGSQ